MPMKKTKRTHKRIFPQTQNRTTFHLGELVTGTRYFAYLPFQNYGCQVLIRVIRVKNVISFQGYSEQIPLISLKKKKNRKEGQTACSKQDFATRKAEPLDPHPEDKG